MHFLFARILCGIRRSARRLPLKITTSQRGIFCCRRFTAVFPPSSDLTEFRIPRKKWVKPRRLVAIFPLLEAVENQLDAAGQAQFIEDPVEALPEDSGSTILGYGAAILGLDFWRSHGTTGSTAAFPMLIAIRPLLDAFLVLPRVEHDRESLSIATSKNRSREDYVGFERIVRVPRRLRSWGEDCFCAFPSCTSNFRSFARSSRSMSTTSNARA